MYRRKYLLLQGYDTDAGSYPSLSLNFTTPGFLDPRITFTRASIGTYYDVAGVLQTATANTPRWDYDPVTHVIRGLFIEEQRINTMLQSGDFTNAAWTKTNCTLVAGILGPNGVVTGSGIVPTNGAIGSAQQTITSTVATYTLSCYAKAATQAQILLFMPAAWWSNATQRSVTFDLVAGTVGTIIGAGATGAITPVGNGWYRISMTATPDLAAAGGVQCPREAVVGDGVSIHNYVFGAQLEVGAFATSYIPTTVATVTRSGDLAILAPIPWFSASAGSLETDFIVPYATLPGGMNPVSMELDDGGSNNLYALRFSNVSQAIMSVFAGNANVGGAAAANAFFPNVLLKHVGTYDAGNLAAKAILNGSTVVSNTYTVAPIGINRLAIGSGRLTQLSGWIQRVQYWSRVLSDAELVSITSLPSLDMDFTSGVLDSRITFTRAAVGTYFDGAGVLQTAGNNVPRFDYDPVTHTMRGLLIEEQRQNLQFPSINWYANATVSATVDGTVQNAGIAPDGTTTAMNMLPSGAVAIHQWYTSFVGALSTTYTHSCFAKANGYNFIFLSLENTAFGANTQNASFNLANGTINSQSVSANATIASIGNGWYRCSVTATSLGTGGNYIGGVRIFDTAGNASSGSPWAGNQTSGVLGWGKQVEVGAFATSYIPTTAAAVTRSLDVATMPTSVWFNQIIGSWVAEFTPNGSWAAQPWVIGSNVNGPSLGINSVGRISTAIRSVIGMVVNVGPTMPIGLPHKLGFTYQSGANLGSTDGTVNSSAATFTTPLTATTVGIGTDIVSPTTSALNGWMRRMTYWPRALSNSELQQVTT